MQHSMQKKSFSGWSMFAAQRKTLRLKMSQALALRTQMYSRMVFQAWKSFITKAQKYRIAQGFSAAKTTEHAMKHWKQYVVLCKIERMIGTSELRQVESSFLSWRKVVAVTHQIRAFRAKSARRHWIELVGRVFKSWKDRTQTHAHCRKLLTSVAVGNHLRFRFMLWQRFTLHRKRLAKLLLVVAEPPAFDNVESKREGLTLEDMNQTALEGELTSVEGIDSELVTREEIQDLHATSDDDGLVSLGYALARKARVLQRFEVTWDLPQAWHRWRQVFHAQLFYRMRRLQLHFICWQRFAYQQRRNRWIVIRLTNQRQSASVQTIFRAWAELVARVKQLQKDRLREREVWVLVTTEMARRERRQLKAHWHAWKFHVEEARHLQSSLDAYHRARLLTKHWLVWRHDFRQIMSEARRETQRVETHMQEFHLRRALRSFIYYQQRSKRARLVLEYFGNRHYDTVLPEVLSRWRQWTQRQKELAYCLATARMNRLRRHYTAWKVLRNTRKLQRVMVNSLQSKSVEQQRRNVWVRWRRYVKSQIVKDQALQKAIIFHVRKRLQKRWLHYTERVVQLRDHAESAHIQLCAFRGHRAVRRWLAYIKTQRLRRLYQRFVLRKHVQLWQSAVKYAMATRFDDFLLRSKVKKMLVAWQRVAAKHQYWRQICAFFVDKKELQTVRRIFLRWRQLVNARQGKRMATLHAEHSLLQRIWRDWNRATLASQLRRHELMEQAAKHEALMLLRQSLATWQYAVKKQRERRFVLLSCVVKLKSVAAQRMQEVVFRAWRRVVEHECRCSVALVKRDSKSAKRALCFWSAWIRDRQRSRQQLQSAAGYHSQRLKSSVFFYWQTYALAWNDAAKPIVRRHARQLSLPAKVAAELRSTNDGKDSDDSDEDIRRPTSPVVKRLRQRKTNRTRAAEDVAGSSDTVPLAEAVEISMDVKKRLLLLGKWKPQRNGTNRSFTSS
ncbi:unnamed protein product [Phytophthora lilii]|uniref:Unnamed protein product n=1 Tax=Phytophthora lilii TaxID=2077276 RepID=A0A9W6TGV0_9STRA|nr:unnamed protein product [Phytophthora lilii]